MSRPLLVGISGPSSSGKTTLSRLLRDIFPPSKLFILHLDDFYKTDADIPVKNGVQDWDCIESINLPQLKSALQHIKERGKSPEWLVSREDQNSVGEHYVPEAEIQRLRDEDMKDIRELFDVKLFLRTSYETAKRRREARSGYVTLEGFWQDPPGYVDNIVWPNYVQDHRFLFKHGDVDGELDPNVCQNVGIHGMPKEAEGDMTRCLNWAAGVLESVIKGSR
ncbi:nicotinamide riboside kinase 1 [Pyrenophora tritici-repentis Pt-1C-BFP]|uniref:Nicotinamide riboside kinase 1 n=1 Tax=Pyrenophora tritici-repentis (strain Pt-1C-BFP) TaxID=426418 RepID=B2W880_PYRTR|nr:nicotinamide riboside kinase 1 [Pyrenophora tritici-repentis Pt-1C-BFP]EDU48938.1 nicotinamide riboside kinase 1 [Pyrenophora tritici-repentis Pt-1C-BFP]